MAASPAFAQESDIDKVRAATAKLINLLVDQGVLTREKAAALQAEMTATAASPSNASAPASAPAGAAKAAGSGTVRVPYIPEFMRKELKDEVRAELAAQAASEGWAAPGSVPEWTRRITWEGDLRVRYELDNFSPENAPAISVNATNQNRAITLQNTTVDTRQWRVRARLGMAAVVDENWSAVVRLTTGSTTNPVSTNQTLGVYNNRYMVLLDRANIRYRIRDEFNTVLGRFGQPWLGTDLVWANDLSYDGLAATWTPSLTPAVRGFGLLAALPVQNVGAASADKWLYAGQVGATATSSANSIGGMVGLGYFYYKNITGKLSPPGSTINEFTAPLFAQKGNTYFNISSDPSRPLLGLAADYHLINLTGLVDFPAFAGKRVLVTGDFVRNVAFNSDAVSQRVGTYVAPMTKAYLVRVAVGSSQVAVLNDWQFFVAYRRVERDAVLDAFNDSDFHLGGTDAKGYSIGGLYGLSNNVVLALRYFSGDAISGAPLAIDVLQLDLNLRF
jgi:hypothetical protein